MRLLPREALIKTSEVDHAEWNYSSLLGFIQRMRFKIAISLLSGQRFRRLLEVGYGSGIFMPELAKYCDELYGIDIHHNEEPVSKILAEFNIAARLFHSDLAAMPFSKFFFDCLVTISTLEYIEDLERACNEIRRVLKPDGYLVIVTPGYSGIVDFGLWVLTGKKTKNEYGQRRQSVVPTLLRHFTLCKKIVAPTYMGWFMCLYRGLKLRVPNR